MLNRKVQGKAEPRLANLPSIHRILQADDAKSHQGCAKLQHARPLRSNGSLVLIPSPEGRATSKQGTCSSPSCPHHLCHKLPETLSLALTPGFASLSPYLPF